MKKFLSLVLALVMTMSLVTIGAGATEYKDFTDKGEVQYEEAVAVLNKLGIITGYEDGSFRPTGALTRGAAAKIIVSLMIGAEAASSLSVAAAPYSDVPVTNTFAGVISYCKTAGYINGYADGTFRPTGALTGYAFSKMLLGALGYDGKVEGFTGSGWTMNVARLGKVAGLFNDFNTVFKGNDGVSREAACLLALNTLKATEVEYTGNTVNVSGKDISVSVGNNKYYPVDNNSKTDGNIPVAVAGTMQFAEEHFSDLKLVGTTSDDFGRPANQWSYKNVTIGKFAHSADYTYTDSASGDTAPDRLKNMGINGLKISTVEDAVTIYAKLHINGAPSTDITDLKAIPNYTAKGTQVEIFTSSTNADLITDVVVINTQLMQVKKVTSSVVTLKVANSASQTAGTKFFQNVNQVEEDEDGWNVLSTLKADAYVLIVPVYDGGSYSVYSAAVPTAVTGNLTTVKLNNSGALKGITVAGTAYSLSANWGSKDNGLDQTTSPDKNASTTVYLDKYGYAIYVTDVAASSDYMVFSDWTTSLVNGKLIYSANGYDMSGKALSLNFGTQVPDPVAPGTVKEYETDTAHNAEYKFATGTDITPVTGAAGTAIKAGAVTIDSNDIDSGIDFIYVTTNSGEVTGVTVKSGVQKVDANVDYTYIVDDGSVVYVVLSDDELDVGSSVLYVYKSYKTTNTAGDYVSCFSAYTSDGEKLEDVLATKSGITTGSFYTYSKNDSTSDYTLKAYAETYDEGKTTSVINADTYTLTARNADAKTATLTGTGDLTFLVTSNKFMADTDITDGTDALVLNTSDVEVIDESGKGLNLTSLEDILNVGNTGSTVTFSVLFNGNDDSNNCGKVAQIIVTAVNIA